MFHAEGGLRPINQTLHFNFVNEQLHRLELHFRCISTGTPGLNLTTLVDQRSHVL